MIQENVKLQLDSIQKTGKKFQTEFANQCKKAEVESRRFLGKMAGADIEAGTPISDVMAKLRENNPTFKRLLLNVDAATYDARESLKWNANMMTAYVKMQAEKSIDTDIKPVLESYIALVETKLNTLSTKANELKSKALN